MKRIFIIFLPDTHKIIYVAILPNADELGREGSIRFSFIKLELTGGCFAPSYDSLIFIHKIPFDQKLNSLNLIVLD